MGGQQAFGNDPSGFILRTASFGEELKPFAEADAGLFTGFRECGIYNCLNLAEFILFF